jgi:signal transduction histidine kinase
VAELFGPLSERYRDYADSIHGAGRHLMQILNDILDLSKIEAGRFELHDEPIGVGEVFDSCRRLVAERALSAGVKLQFAPSELGIRADPLRLKQVLLNLLSNAIKFTPSGGSVTVDAGVNSAGSITIQVRDSGIGMRPEDIPLAFEPFGQVDNSLTRSQQGTGLGLPLVRRLVELHGGEVCLSSAPGQGTTVTLTFPPDRTLDQIQAEAASDNG